MSQKFKNSGIKSLILRKPNSPVYHFSASTKAKLGRSDIKDDCVILGKTDSHCMHCDLTTGKKKKNSGVLFETDAGVLFITKLRMTNKEPMSDFRFASQDTSKS